MRRRVAVAFVLAAVCPAAVAGTASACSYAVPADLGPRELTRQLLRGSDGAFVGRLISLVPRGGADAGQPFARGTYLFRVERSVKGRFPLGVAIVDAPIQAGLCGLPLRVGQRTGLMLDRKRGRWTSQLILVESPRALIRAARRR